MNPLASWLTLLIVIPIGVGILWGVSLIFNLILDHIANAAGGDNNAMHRGRGSHEEKE